MSTCVKFALLTALLSVSAACTVQETPAPPLTGPSELALRLALRAIPDSILQDGASQAVIEIEAGGPNGQPIGGLPLRIETAVGGALQDFGTLSAKTVVTDNNGRARVIYTAPPRPVEPVDSFVVVTFLVTPIGNDHRGEQARQLDVRLVPPGVILPPNSAPRAAFTVTGTQEVNFNLVFDASTTTDADGGTNPDGSPQPCGQACTYRWDFGDGATATGIFATHAYTRSGPFRVTLTATDARGASSTTSQTVQIGGGTPPTATFNFSPTTPAINQPVFFNAEASRAQSGRRIVSYEWNFGTGATASGVTTSKSFSAAGTYNVTLTVTDDAGNRGTVTQSVIVGGAGTGPTAALTVSPTQGSTATNFFFDASNSRQGPNPIVEYRFTFGDATPDVVGASPTTTHRYATPGTYTASVTIRDSAGRTAVATVSVTVQ